jgi:hypothetical protein
MLIDNHAVVNDSSEVYSGNQILPASWHRGTKHGQVQSGFIGRVKLLHRHRDDTLDDGDGNQVVVLAVSLKEGLIK